MGMIATSDVALAWRCGTCAHSTCRGTITKPPPTPSSPPSRPPANPIAAKRARLAIRWSRRGLGLVHHHRVVAKLNVGRGCPARLLRLLLLFRLAALLVPSFTHGDQFLSPGPVRARTIRRR